MKRRILVFSASFGGGHRAAAEALARYYRAHYADAVDVRVVDFFEEFVPSLNVLAKFAYQQSEQFFPDAVGTFDDLSDQHPSNPVVHELRLTGLPRVRACVDEFAPDAVISTAPIAGSAVAELKLSRSLVSATVFTGHVVGLTWLHPATDLSFVACREAREELVVRGVPWDRVVVSGIPVGEEFSTVVGKAEARRAARLAERFTVLLTGAAGSASEVRDIAAQIAASQVQVAAVTGHNTRLKGRMETLARREELVRVYGFVDDMHRMMRAADVLVSHAGGLIVAESLAVGLPLVLHSTVPGQESGNVDFMVNSGVGLLSRDAEDVVEKVRFLSSHPLRLGQMAENARELGRPAATQAICERVLAALR